MPPDMPDNYDLAVIGAGPAGTACALAACQAGWRVALVERAAFPRHKVCGDCLNPSLWPVLETLGTAAAIRALDHAPLDRVRFVSESGRPLEVPLPSGAERAVTRESFDVVMLQAALDAGAVLVSGSPLTALKYETRQWHLATSTATLTAGCVVAADGRNSTTCRLLGLSPANRPGRLALQCHAPLHPDYQGTVSLEWMAHGYCGIAPVDDSRMNLCLVSKAAHLAAAKAEIHRRFELPDGQAWHSIAPLERADIPAAPFPGCFLAGDAARVVEPFTGEGIYYALRSGQLAAAAAGQWLAGDAAAADHYRRAHRALYQNRLWVNRLSRLAVTHRWLGRSLLGVGRYFPRLLSALTAKIVHQPG
jgi:menaquinone-9 beta-reductase